jgi:uncharacterized protein YdaU (DUF1376 family)
MSLSVNIFFPFYVGDYMKKTTMLSCEEHGAYFLLLCSLWQNEGFLPYDLRKLARICHLDYVKFADVWAEIESFFEVTGDKISNNRVNIELEKAKIRKERSAVNGARGGRPISKINPVANLNETQQVISRLPEHNPPANLNESSSPSPSPSPSHTPIQSKSHTKKNSSSEKKFEAPTFSDVMEYAKSKAIESMEEGYHGIKYYRFEKSEVTNFFQWYDTSGWKDRDGKPIVNWKLRFITWVKFYIEKLPKQNIEGV